MRILVINPNSTEAVTRGIVEAVGPLRMAGGPAIDHFTKKCVAARNTVLNALPEAPELRERAYRIKQETMANLDRYLEQMADAVFTGIKRYFAKNPPLARDKIGTNP